MAYLLRSLLIVMFLSILITVGTAFDWIAPGFSHIQIAIPAFMLVMFIQAFVMFYFIGISRLVNNVYNVLHSTTNLHELFDSPPEDLSPYKKKVVKYVHDTTTCKRQTIPWTMLILILGMGAFFLGGALDTGLVQKKIHVGLVYGFSAALIIGFFRQWYYLGKSHKTLRELKALFDIPDAQM